jgi:hypothetical protein
MTTLPAMAICFNRALTGDTVPALLFRQLIALAQSLQPLFGMTPPMVIPERRNDHSNNKGTSAHTIS